MRINLLNYSDYAGGSSRAVYRLHRGLLHFGQQSRLLVWEKYLADDTVYRLGPTESSRLATYAQRAFNRMAAWRRRRALAGAESFFTWDSEAPLGAEAVKRLPPADITHLHWISRFLRLDALPALLAHRPAIWTLHDANLAYGGWHYEPSAGEITPAIAAEDKRLARRKRKLLGSIPAGRLVFVCPSQWLAARISPIPEIGRHRIEVIANGVETDFFLPGNRASAREALGLPVNRPVLGFVAHSLADRRKGLQVLLQACAGMDAARRPVILCAGGGTVTDPDVFSIGPQQSDFTLRLLYRAADIFVCPSLQDNLPNTILESLACGTPVVASAVGGIPEAVGEGIGGSLVPPGDPDSLGVEIIRLLGNPRWLGQLAVSARERAVTLFSQRGQAQRHIRLYEELFEDGSPSP